MRHPPPFTVIATALSVAILCLCGVSSSFAAPPVSTAQADDERRALMSQLSRTLPELRLSRLYPSELPGLYEGLTEEGSWIYVNRDGTRVLVGQLFGLDTGRVVDLTAQHRQRWVRELLQGVPDKEFISYSPAKPKHHVVVFTDINCGYCQLLHRERGQLNALGIAVHYLAFPRAGVGSESYDRAISAWCAHDPKNALTQFKSMPNSSPSEQSARRRDCDVAMVGRHYQLGQRIGVSGTPALVFEDGQVFPGYVPAAELADMLGQNQLEAARP